MTRFLALHKEPPLGPEEAYPLFTRLSLETHSRCNRRCSFCPHATGRRDFPMTYLRLDVIERLANELGKLDWDGFLQLFELNEPLLDWRLERIAELFRAKVPRATLYVSTNGDTVDRPGGVERLAALFDAGVNSLNLNVYDTGVAGVQQQKRHEWLADELVRRGIASRPKLGKYSRRPATARHVYVTDMRTDRPATGAKTYDEFFEKISESRSGAALDAPCPRPHRHLVVLHDGSVPLCCQGDPTDDSLPRLGNVLERSLVEVWNDPAWRPYRYHLAERGGRAKFAACANCRATTAYPWAVRRVEPPNEETA